MTYKSTTQPLCRCCGKPIGKRTTSIYFGSGQSHYGRPEFPRDKAEAQKLVNLKIVSVRYHRYDPDNPYKVDGRPEHDWVSWANLWDGETYRDAFFCGDPCAVQFAYAYAGAGHACMGYVEALAKREKGKAA